VKGTAPIVRRGVQVNLCLDVDVIPLMKLLSPSSKRYGALISSLLRQEMVRREERQAMLKELQALVPR
jgi:hypothetical protein